MEKNYEIDIEKNQLETPKRYTVKTSDKTQNSEAIIIQNRYEVLIDEDESDTNECNKQSIWCNVTARRSSQVNLRNNGVKKDQHKHKSKTKEKEEERVIVLRWLLRAL